MHTHQELTKTQCWRSDSGPGPSLPCLDDGRLHRTSDTAVGQCRMPANLDELAMREGSQRIFDAVIPTILEGVRPEHFLLDGGTAMAWMDDNLTAKGLSGGGCEYKYEGTRSLLRVPLETMQRMDPEERLHFTSRGASGRNGTWMNLRGVRSKTSGPISARSTPSLSVTSPLLSNLSAMK